MKPRRKKINPLKKNAVYEKQYDTTEEAKLSKFLRDVKDRITLHKINKIIRMQDPEFASTDAQRFVHEYYRKKFKNKLKNLSDDPLTLYDENKMRYLQLQEVSSNLNFKDNAAFTGDKFIYNGRVNDKYFPTFADVMAHEAGHQLDSNFLVSFDGKYNNPSYIYKPFVENNKDLYNVRRYSKYADEVINFITNDDMRAYSVYHDAYPSEVFADLISDKYRMNVNNIYNSLGNTPFTENDYETYRNYLKKSTNFQWSRGMYQLIKPGLNYDLPDKLVYTKAMNDL